MKREHGKQQTWRPPTRRAFVTMLGAAAAALALREGGARLGGARLSSTPADDPPRSPWAGTTRWIGHC